MAALQFTVDDQVRRFTTQTVLINSGSAPSAAVDLTAVFANNAPGARRIFVGGAGTLTVKRQGDATAVQYTLPAGAYLEGFFVSVGLSGDTATKIIAEY